ncbi:MAG: hypothetical protein GTO14_15180 [Anaerolineales bacterium]|nr:hypothetical protein [Anaerolineales bacterium]
MTMDEIRIKVTMSIKLGFWRLISALLGWAVRYKPTLGKPATYMPYVVAGIVAYFVGRMFGGMLLRTGLF